MKNKIVKINCSKNLQIIIIKTVIINNKQYEQRLEKKKKTRNFKYKT